MSFPLKYMFPKQTFKKAPEFELQYSLKKKKKKKIDD